MRFLDYPISRASLAAGLLILVCACSVESPQTRPLSEAPAARGNPRPHAALTAVPHGAGEIRLTWNGDPLPAGGLILQRRTAQQAWQQLGPAPLDSTSYTDRVGEVRERFLYRLIRDSTNGSAPWSDVATAVPGLRGRPLVGWINVGDFVNDPAYAGTVDAIQAAIGKLSDRHAGAHVLYFPDGEYRIDRTLYLEGKPGAQFVGESAGGVVLRWTGKKGRSPDDVQVLFHAEGNRDATWRNLVWDGGCEDPANCFVVAFDQSYCGLPGALLYSEECDALPYLRRDVGQADSGSAHADSVFRNAYIGLRIGHYQVQDSEISVRRSAFTDNFIGVGIEDQNALDEWFWDCRFESNYVALTNDVSRVRRGFDPGYKPGHCREQPERECLAFGVNGNSPDCRRGDSCDYLKRIGGDFDVYRGRFVANNRADMSIRPGGEFTIRGCWSTGSGHFLEIPDRTGSGFVASLIDNRVGQFDPDDRFGGRAVSNAGPGPLILVDNEFHSSASQISRGQAPIFAGTFVPTDLLAVGNGYTVEAGPNSDPGDGPYAFDDHEHRLHSFDDRRIPSRIIVPPEMPQVADPLRDATVYTVVDSAKAPEVIRAALADPGRTVVHFPDGLHDLRQKLAIPSGRDFVLMGDGPWTRLNWAGGGNGPMLEIDASTGHEVIVRDLQFHGAGILVENLKQSGVGVLASQLRISRPGSAGVVLDDVDRNRVDFIDYMAGRNTAASGMLIRVGDEILEPAAKPGVAVWTGNTGGWDWDFDVINGGSGVKLLVSSTYMEDSRHHLRLRGKPGPGEVTLHNGKISTIVPLSENGAGELEDATATVDAVDYQGLLSLVGSVMFIQKDGQPCCSDPRAVDHGARIRTSGRGSGRIRALGNVVRPPADPANATPECSFGGSADFLRLAGKLRGRGGTVAQPDIRVRDGRRAEPVADRQSLAPAAAAELSRQVQEALALLRELEPPRHHDQIGADSEHRIHLDEVFIWNAASYALLLQGTEACRSDSDCGGSTCDRTGLPAGVPGRCR